MVPLATSKLFNRARSGRRVGKSQITVLLLIVPSLRLCSADHLEKGGEEQVEDYFFCWQVSAYFLESRTKVEVEQKKWTKNDFTGIFIVHY